MRASSTTQHVWGEHWFGVLVVVGEGPNCSRYVYYLRRCRQRTVDALQPLIFISMSYVAKDCPVRSSAAGPQL